MTARPRVVYVAGPYRAPTPWAVEQNIRRAEDIAARVWAMGLIAMCPHANSRHMEGAASDEVFLAGTMELLRRCDAVILVPGWGASSGTRAEVLEAQARGMPIFGFGSGAFNVAMYGRNHYDEEVDIAMHHLKKWHDGQTEAAR